MGYFYDDSAATLLGVYMMLILLLVIFVSLAALVVTYVLTAIASQAIARKRGIAKPFFAWIPVANTYLLGKIADDVNICRRNKKTNFAKNLLTLMIVFYGVFFLYYIYYLISTFAALVPTLHGVYTILSVVGLLIYFVYCIIAIVQSVFAYMAIYRIYYGYAENQAALFLVLSIFVPISMPIILFALRNKELLPPDPATFPQSYGFPTPPPCAPVQEPVVVQTTPVVETTTTDENNSNMEDNTNE